MKSRILSLSLERERFLTMHKSLATALFILAIFFLTQKANAQCNISCPADVSMSACQNNGTEPANTGSATIDCDGYEVTYADSETNLDINGCTKVITRTWTAAPNSCEPVTLAKWDMNACYATTSDNSPMDYSEFTPMYPNNGGFGSINANFDRQDGKHSCTYGLNNSLATCFGMDDNVWSDNDSEAIRFNITLNPNNIGSLTGISFYELAPTQYQWVSDYNNTNNNEASGVNNYPTKYGIRILKNGVEVFKQINIPTTQQWSLEDFDFSNNNAFSITQTTTFEIELLAYDPIGNGSEVYAWDIEDFYIYGCSGVNGTTETCTQIITLEKDLTATVTSNGTMLSCEQTSIQLMGSSNMNDAFYAWTGPNNYASNEQNPTITEAGIYTLTVIKDCCVSSATVEITQGSGSLVALPAVDQSLSCEVSTVQLSGTTNQAGASYSWTGPNGFTSNEQNPTTSEAGTYTLTVEKDACSVSADIEVMTDGILQCEYDLALIKILAEGQASIVAIGDEVNFIVKVTNQGDTPSGAYQIMDRLPEGMTFVSAGMGGIHNNGTVTWDLSDLAEGDFIELPVTATVDVLGTGKYINWAEITQDSGDDDDSTPDTNTGFGFTDPNDLVENHNDMMLDNSPNDEDDNDFEEIFVERGLQLLTRANLQGALPTNSSETLMRDDLRSEGFIPASEPYTLMNNFENAGFGGGEVAAAGVLEATGDDAVIDWMFIEIRDANNPSTVLATCAGLLQADGEIVAPDGVSSLAFPNLEDDYYYVALRHRNHLGTMTATPVFLSSENATSVDFTTIDTYGAHAQHTMANGQRAMWSGDLTSSGSIVFQGAGNGANQAFFDVLGDPENVDLQTTFISSGYHRGDCNMDCNVRYQGVDNEVNFMFFNVLGYPSNVNNLPNFVIEEKLP